MKQTRVCCYFNSGCRHLSPEPTTFLSLPEQLRHRILRDTGLFDADPVELHAEDGVLRYPDFDEERYYLFAAPWSPPKYPSMSADCETFNNLMLASRVVSEDVYRCFCSCNNLRLRDLGRCERFLPSGLRRTLKYLRCLSIKLMVEKKHHADCSPDCVSCYWTHEYGSSQKSARKMVSFLRGWNHLIDALSSCDTSQLKLSLLFDVPDSRAAQLLLDPLKKLRLAACNIRLSKDWRPILRSIARETVLHVTNRETRSQTPFRYSDLPTELRQHVLSYTDLVAPNREIIWDPVLKFHLYDLSTRITPTMTTNHFCSCRHTAFPSCSCRTPPTAIFLVSRQSRCDARAVFFSLNRFTICPPGAFDGPKPGYYAEVQRNRSFEASTFFTNTIPTEALPYLRDLEILWPPHSYGLLGVDPCLTKEWECAIQHIALHTKRLTLDMRFGRPNDWSSNLHDITNFEHGSKALIEMYEQIVRPLAGLPSLDSLYLELELPYGHNKHTASLTRHLETLAMGTDYDSDMERKAQRAKSSWDFDPYSAKDRLVVEGLCTRR